MTRAEWIVIELNFGELRQLSDLLPDNEREVALFTLRILYRLLRKELGVARKV